MQRPSYLADRRETEINAAVAAHFGLAPEELLRRSRKQPIAHARHIAMYLLRRYGYSYERIGNVYGKTHYVPMYAVEKITDWLQIYPEVQQQVETITAKITPTFTLSQP